MLLVMLHLLFQNSPVNRTVRTRKRNMFTTRWRLYITKKQCPVPHGPRPVPNDLHYFWPTLVFAEHYLQDCMFTLSQWFYRTVECFWSPLPRLNVFPIQAKNIEQKSFRSKAMSSFLVRPNCRPSSVHINTIFHNLIDNLNGEFMQEGWGDGGVMTTFTYRSISSYTFSLSKIHADYKWWHFPSSSYSDTVKLLGNKHRQTCMVGRGGYFIKMLRT